MLDIFSLLSKNFTNHDKFRLSVRNLFYVAGSESRTAEPDPEPRRNLSADPKYCLQDNKFDIFTSRCTHYLLSDKNEQLSSSFLLALGRRTSFFRLDRGTKRSLVGGKSSSSPSNMEPFRPAASSGLARTCRFPVRKRNSANSVFLL
jgi:hypothetical protein